MKGKERKLAVGNSCNILEGSLLELEWENMLLLLSIRCMLKLKPLFVMNLDSCTLG